MPDQNIYNANYHYDSAAYPKLRIYGQRQEVIKPHSNEKEIKQKPQFYIDGKMVDNTVVPVLQV